MLNPITPSGGVNTPTPRFNKSPDRRVGYPFAAIPAELIGRIKPGPLQLLSRLLCLRQPSGPWCWASNARLAEWLGISDRQIREQGKQLIKAGVVARHRVPNPDPDDPRNQTGWRWEFTGLSQIDAEGKKTSSVQACGKEENFPSVSMQGGRKTVGAEGKKTSSKSEGFNSEREEDRSIGISSSTHEEKTEDADAGEDAFAKGLAIIAEWKQADLAQSLESERDQWVGLLTSEHAIEAFHGAIKETCSYNRVIRPSQCTSGSGLTPQDGLRNPIGYLASGFRKYLKGDIPARIRKLKPPSAQKPAAPSPSSYYQNPYMASVEAAERAARAAIPQPETLKMTDVEAKPSGPSEAEILASLGLDTEKLLHPIPALNNVRISIIPQIVAARRGMSLEAVYAEQATRYGRSPQEIADLWAKAIADHVARQQSSDWRWNKPKPDPAELAAREAQNAALSELTYEQRDDPDIINAHLVSKGLPPIPVANPGWKLKPKASPAREPQQMAMAS